jgi:hypothetical protein
MGIYILQNTSVVNGFSHIFGNFRAQSALTDAQAILLSWARVPCAMAAGRRHSGKTGMSGDDAG